MQTVAGQPLQLVVLCCDCSTICNIGFVVGVGGTATSKKSTMAVVGQIVVPATTPSIAQQTRARSWSYVISTSIPRCGTHVVDGSELHELSSSVAQIDSVGALSNQSCAFVLTRVQFRICFIFKLDLQN